MATACIVTVAMYGLLFFPAQVRLAEATSTYETAQGTQIQRQAARKTQEALAKIWKQLPARKDFTGLSVSIASLAKKHKVRIPGMGYDIQSLKHDLASKGILSFEASGQYVSIRKFIYEMESQWPHLFIEKLTAERSKKRDEVSFKIKVATYLKTDPQNS